jgi:hypothetical protein
MYYCAIHIHIVYPHTFVSDLVVVTWRAIACSLLRLSDSGGGKGQDLCVIRRAQ